MINTAVKDPERVARGLVRLAQSHRQLCADFLRDWTIETCGDATPQSGRFYETEAEAQAEAKRLTDQAEVSSGRT